MDGEVMTTPAGVSERVTEVQARTISIPLRKPLAFATRYVERREYTIVRLRTSGGLEGVGYSYVGNRAGHLVTQFVDFFRDHVLGADPYALETTWARMYRDAVLLGRRGAAVRAMSAIDVALWDIIGKAGGLPLHRLLGGPKGDRVPCYASGGYYWEDTDPDRFVFDEMRSYVEDGFTAVKMKVGRLPLNDEMRRARAAREAIGPNTILMMDANNAWPDAASAAEAMRALTEVNPFWIEEPLMPDDMAGHVALQRKVTVPIATGEIEQTRWGFGALIEHRAVDILQPDATVLGGLTEFRKVAAMAAAASLPLYPHWMHHLHTSIVAAIPNAMMVEYFPTLDVLNLGDVLQDPIRASGGTLPLPQTPGISVTFDEKALDRFAVDAWH
ncbi:MAG: mandelate racemase/muconate lactonizing enzyme family protein [Acidobacteria bacterium]|nr:mandelate racemase/muconate lactonizing enzyme family protein [Acidobacteriota bacterium]